MISIKAVIAIAVVCVIFGACLGVALIALCMANGGYDDEDTGCSSPESKPEDISKS